MPFPVSVTAEIPLMLAPMQGVTNRAMRKVMGEIAKPDILFTEFVRVRPKSKTPIAPVDFTEATTRAAGIPLVVQVIGCADEGVVQAVRDLVARGVTDINVNMGCPFGRMTSVLAGGGMFKAPDTVEPMLAALREIVPGSLSVKTRLGIEGERELFEILPAFEGAGIDFLIVHARTVKQKYRGQAAHDLTQEVVQSTSVPVIANGDVRDAQTAHEVLAKTGAAGLMLGRGAVSRPQLFEEIRHRKTISGDRRQEVSQFLRELLDGYCEVFSGDAQVLAKMKEILALIDEEDLGRFIKKLKKQKDVEAFRALLVDVA